jgi:hypothetical protein
MHDAADPEENALFRACPEDHWLIMLNPEDGQPTYFAHSR